MPYLDRFVRFAATLLWTSLLIGFLALAAIGEKLNPALSAAKPMANLADVVGTGLAVTGAFMGKAIAAALLPALVAGALAGWRRGSLPDRLLSLPALLLAGAPVTAISLVAVWVCLVNKWSVFQASGQWVAALLFFPWLALAVRDGVAGARADGRWQRHRTALAVLGRLLQQSGNLLAIQLVLEPFWMVKGGLSYALLRGVQDARPLMTGLALVTGAALWLHLAGDLLVTATHREQVAPSRPSRTWLATGALLTAVLVAAALLSWETPTVDVVHRNQGPTAEHLLGTDFSGRDVAAQLAAGARKSLGYAGAAAGIALAAGLMLGALGARTGPIGAAILTPRVPAPSLLGAFLWSFVAYGTQNLGAWLVVVILAIGALPALAHAARRTFASAPGERWRTARTLLAGTALVALGQTLTVELMQIPARTLEPAGTLGRVIYSVSLGAGKGANMILAAAFITAGVAGLMVLGFALRDAAGTEVGG
ncbi:MAG TPA: hypothetical protein VK464_19955 [Symbiobacteriaceae bacterium]|jgi:ABC-type dipeptide/oligopeptide/nickel transport system permease subunit|nr:hypothetical protein [Symbiobacteriaceae bacterium]